jgi:hypothetical protein
MKPDDDLDFDNALEIGAFDEFGEDPNDVLLHNMGVKPAAMPKESVAPTVDKRVSEQMRAVYDNLNQQQKKMADVIKMTNEGQFTLTLVFASRKMRDEFVEKAKLGGTDTRFVDGRSVAKLMGMDVYPEIYRPVTSKRK